MWQKPHACPVGRTGELQGSGSWGSSWGYQLMGGGAPAEALLPWGRWDTQQALEPREARPSDPLPSHAAQLEMQRCTGGWGV